VRYQDRDTFEYYESPEGGRPLPIEEIKVKLHQVKASKTAEDLELDDKIYNIVKGSFKAYKGIKLIEEAELEKADEEKKKEEDKEEKDKADYTVKFEVSVQGDVIRVAYKVIDAYKGEHKSGSGTFQGHARLESIVKDFTRKIYNSLPKEVNEKKLEKVITINKSKK
jgi:hypothetical protein